MRPIITHPASRCAMPALVYCQNRSMRAGTVMTSATGRLAGSIVIAQDAQQPDLLWASTLVIAAISARVRARTQLEQRPRFAASRSIAARCAVQHEAFASPCLRYDEGMGRLQLSSHCSSLSAVGVSTVADRR